MGNAMLVMTPQSALISALSQEDRKAICIELRHMGRNETYCDRFGAKGQDPPPNHGTV